MLRGLQSPVLPLHHREFPNDRDRTDTFLIYSGCATIDTANGIVFSTGIEPISTGLQPVVLPLNYKKSALYRNRTYVHSLTGCCPTIERTGHASAGNRTLTPRFSVSYAPTYITEACLSLELNQNPKEPFPRMHPLHF